MSDLGGNGLKREKCTKYFFNLEKINFEVSSLSKLKINDVVCDDKIQISKYVADFYQGLYSTDVENAKNMDLFLKSKQNYLDVIDDGFKLVYDREICLS